MVVRKKQSTPKLEKLKQEVKPKADKKYSDLVQKLIGCTAFMKEFEEYKRSISGGLDFLEELDVTFKGRYEKAKQVAKVLSKKRDNICALVGDAGEGKTTLAKKMAELVNNREIQLNQPYYFVILKVNILKMKALGDDKLLKEMENVLENLFRLQEKAIEYTGLKNIRFIAFFDEAHKLLSAFGNDNKLGGDALKEGLTPAKIGAIAATTRDEYNETFSKDVPLRQRFEVVQMDRMGRKDVLELGKAFWEDLEKLPPKYNHSPLLEEDIERLNTWAGIFFPDEAEPRRSNRLLELLEAHCRTEQIPPNLEAIKDVFKFRGTDPDIKIPIKRVLDYLDKLVGQELVKMQIEELLYQIHGRAGERGNQPILNLFFFGPTGVGKTELVNLLNAAIYGDDSEPIDISIPSYADDKDGGTLLLRDIGLQVKNKPASVIDVGEYEKGVPNKHNVNLKTNVQPLFLDLTDKGVVKYKDDNGNGRPQTYSQSVRSTIIVFTSNAGFEVQENRDKFEEKIDYSKLKSGQMKDELANLQSLAKNWLVEHYGISREFLGRMTAFLVFTSLGEYNGILLAERMLEEYFATFEKEKGIIIERNEPEEVNAAYIDGTNDNFKATDLAVFIGRTKSDMKSSSAGGARQIKRVIATEIESYIGKALYQFEEKYGRKPSKIKVWADNNGIDPQGITRDQMEVNVECIA